MAGENIMFPGSAGPLDQSGAAGAATQGAAQQDQGGPLATKEGQFVPLKPKPTLDLPIPGPMGAIINTIVNMHTFKQNAAIGELNRQVQAAGTGWGPLMKQGSFLKTLKKAGFDTTSPEELTQAARGMVASAGAGQQGAGQGGQSGLPTDPNSGLPLTGKEQPYPPPTTGMNPEEKARSRASVFFDGIARQGLQNAKLLGANDTAQQQLAGQFLDLKKKALAGDDRAWGQLQKLGMVPPPDLPYEKWKAMTPEQRQHLLNFEAGYESDESVAKRIDSTRANLMNQYPTLSPNDANRMATSLANGHGVPGDISQNLPPITMSGMMDIIKWGATAAEMGFTGPQLNQMADNAHMAGGLKNLFPDGFTPMAQKIEQDRQRSLELEGERADDAHAALYGYDKRGPDGKMTHVLGSAELERLKYEALAKEMEANANTAARKDALEKFAMLLDLSRSKGISQDVLIGAENEVIRQFGGQYHMEQLEGWRGFVSRWVPGGSFFTGTEKKAPGAPPPAPGDTKAAGQASSGAAAGEPPGGPSAPAGTDLTAVGEQHWGPVVRDAATRYGVDPHLASALVEHESGWNPTAESESGALGLGQFVRGTGKDYGMVTAEERKDPYKNADATAHYISDLINKRGGSVVEALKDFYGREPYHTKEQQEAYASSIMSLWRRKKREAGGTASRPTNAPAAAAATAGAAKPTPAGPAGSAN